MHWKNRSKIYPLFSTCNHLLRSHPHSSTWPHYNHPSDLTPPKSNHHIIHAANHPTSLPPHPNNTNPPQPTVHPNHLTLGNLQNHHMDIPNHFTQHHSPINQTYHSYQQTSPTTHHIKTTHFRFSGTATFTSKTTTQCTTTTPTTTTTQSTFRSDGEHEKVSHHIQHVHERKAIKTYLSEHSHRRVCSKNKEKNHHRQAIKNHTNQNLIVNLTNHHVPQPLQSMLSKGLNFVPTSTHSHPIHCRFLQKIQKDNVHTVSLQRLHRLTFQSL